MRNPEKMHWVEVNTKWGLLSVQEILHWQNMQLSEGDDSKSDSPAPSRKRGIIRQKVLPSAIHHRSKVPSQGFLDLRTEYHHLREPQKTVPRKRGRSPPSHAGETKKIKEVVEGLINKIDRFDHSRKITFRDLQRLGLGIRDLERSDDEQLRNFQTLSDVIDNIRAELNDFRGILSNLTEGQERLAENLDRLVQVNEQRIRS